MLQLRTHYKHFMRGALGLLLSLGLSSFASQAWSSDRVEAYRAFGSLANINNPQNSSHFAFPVAIGMGARPLGMGEAFAGLADELSAIWWNPAGLVQTDKNEIQWMGGDRYTGAPFTGFFAANFMLQNRMNFALSFMRPYHMTGFIPRINAATYQSGTGSGGFDKWTGANNGVIVPGSGRTDFYDETFTDTAVKDFLKKVYRDYINPAFQENILGFTFATPLSPDNLLSMGINVKYLFNDNEYRADGALLNEATGYGVDLGFLYRIPMARYGREFAVGLNVRDIASQVRFSGNGSREITLARTADLGLAWKTREYLVGSKLNLTADLIYIDDPSFNDNANRRVNVGSEMWFFKERIAPRMGYSLFFNRQLSRPTLGMSFRMNPPDKDGIGLDYAYHFPSENEENATHWFTLNYRWGGIRKTLPLPEVNVSVDPPIFAPRRGETATFSMKADSPNGIERWTLTIVDRNNNVVKTYQDRGEAPAQIVWGGEDKQYRLLPDGEYTFLFTATDREGSSSSTPVQTLKIFTPKEPEAQTGLVDELRKMIKGQDDKEEVIDQQVKGSTIKDLQALVAERRVNQTLPPIAKEPVAPQPITPAAEARIAAGSFAYPRANEQPYPRTSVVNGPDGKAVYSVEFVPTETQPRLILRDAADMARVAAADAGASVARLDIKAMYGNRELRVVAPLSAGLSLARGRITREQFIESSAVTLDGSPLSPAYR